MSIVLVIWNKLELALRLSQAFPGIGMADAYAHATAAVEAAQPGLPPDLLLAIAYVESRFDPTATSRIEGDVRRTGSYRSRRPPPDLRGSLFCGPLQAYARSWKQCLGLRDLATGYATGVDELARWLEDRRVRGDIRRALLGHACGNHGVKTGRCNGYPRRVFQFHRRLVGSPPATRTRTPTRTAERSLM